MIKTGSLSSTDTSYLTWTITIFLKSQMFLIHQYLILPGDLEGEEKHVSCLLTYSRLNLVLTIDILANVTLSEAEKLDNTYKDHSETEATPESVCRQSSWHCLSQVIEKSLHYLDSTEGFTGWVFWLIFSLLYVFLSHFPLTFFFLPPANSSKNDFFDSVTWSKLSSKLPSMAGLAVCGRVWCKHQR